MTAELPTRYDPAAVEDDIYQRWLAHGAFRAVPDGRDRRYVVMMPLPNVTGALHMGHAMDNVMQDLLVRWHRMQGDNALWQPGTDHAGIGTQAVVEKRLQELEGKTRHDLGRDELVRRIWAWKDQYQERIVKQQQRMGCSCDWSRQRFTMDAVCTAAVREAFFRLFQDGLVFRGLRLVNWDCHLQTAVADDEVVHETVRGHFWHLRYPVIDPGPDEPEFVVVATTRPETMLGDTAVACHPEPRAELQRQLAELRAKEERASAKEKSDILRDLQRLEAAWDERLPELEVLVRMAHQGRRLRLPLVDREIPLVLDRWADPALGSGCVKVTPGHDPNDYAVWQRHRARIGIVSILEPDGRLNESAGAYRGLDRFVARKQVVKDLEAKGLVERVEDREVDIGHSDRSKTPIEPFLSKQWFVRMGDVPGGITLGRGTPRAFHAAGLAQAAMDAVRGDWRSATGRKVRFWPDAERYANTYWQWLSEKRDWCISRQLWWGHQIPIWQRTVSAGDLPGALDRLPELPPQAAWVWVSSPEGELLDPAVARRIAATSGGDYDVQVCVRRGADDAALGSALHEAGFARDTDVLDTWFSSMLWPLSTLGWPDPARAEVGSGQTRLGPDGAASDSLGYYYPGSCLVTGRDIITLWVARMVVGGLYLQGDVPFTDVFIHANILDGKGERMSKSKGNGIDPVDIIERYGADAMRYVLCDMQTGLQDIRLPVQAVSPYTGNLVDLATAKHGRSIFCYLDPDTGKEFDVLGTLPELPAAKIISDRFEVGRNFCNKVWNAARFALLNLEELDFVPRRADELAVEDRWILARLRGAIAGVTSWLDSYNPSAAAGVARDFFWSELCDWYLELIKPRLKDAAAAPIARQVLAAALDQSLRLLHPFVPFLTEAIWEHLGRQAPVRGVGAPLATHSLLVLSPWPRPESMEVAGDAAELERRFARLQDLVRGVRDLRKEYQVPPSKRLPAWARAPAAVVRDLRGLEAHVQSLCGLESLVVGEDVAKPALAATRVVGETEVFLAGVLDTEKERGRLTAQRDKLRRGIESLDQKIGNPGFLAKAPAEVVSAERQRLTELRAELARVEQGLAALGG